MPSARNHVPNAAIRANPLMQNVNMLDTSLLPDPYPAHGTQASLLKDDHRVRTMAKRANRIEASTLSANQNLVLPPVTDPSTLLMNSVADSVGISVRTSRRLASDNRMRRTQESADAMLERQSRQSYEPGLAESPPDMPHGESSYFDPEAQSMPSHDQQQAAEQPLRQPPRVENRPDPPLQQQRNEPQADLAQERPHPDHVDAPHQPPALNPQNEEPRAIPDHPGFITDDRQRWPELHSLGPIDQANQHCKGCGAAHWFEERTAADQKKPKDRPVTFRNCCNHNTIRLRRPTPCQ